MTIRDVSLVCLLLILCGCNYYKQEHPKKIVKIYSWGLDDVMSYFDLSDKDSLRLKLMLDIGVFRPNDTCSGYISVQDELVWGNTTEDLNNIFKHNDTLHNLVELVKLK